MVRRCLVATLRLKLAPRKVNGEMIKLLVVDLLVAPLLVLLVAPLRERSLGCTPLLL